MPNELEGISRAIKVAADHREQEREKANLERGEPALFVPDAEPENQKAGFGIGYWIDRAQKEILAFRRMANGYELYPCARYSVTFLQRLIRLWETGV